MAAGPFHCTLPQSWSVPTSVQASPDVSPARAAAALQTQIEFYFSPQNLASDVYLCAQMDADRFVSLALIADFKLVKKLTDDPKQIVDAVRHSKLLELNPSATMVRAVLKPASRTTIILRDIASDTPVEEVERIFADEECAPIVTIRADIADTWFVTFADEPSCLRTAEALRDKTFAGNPIRFRIKSENLARSFRHAPPSSSSSFQPRPVWNIRRGNCLPVYEGMPVFAPPMMPMLRRYNTIEPRRKMSNYNNNINPKKQPTIINNNQHHHHPGQMRPRKAKAPTTAMRPKHDDNQQFNGAVTKEQQPELGLEHFPALPSAKTPASSPTRSILEPLANMILMARMEESAPGGQAVANQDEEEIEDVGEKVMGEASYASIASRAKGSLACVKTEATTSSE